MLKYVVVGVPNVQNVHGHGPLAPLGKSVGYRVILYGLTSERRRRSPHPTQPEALGLNPSLTVDSMRARLLGSAEIETA